MLIWTFLELLHITKCNLRHNILYYHSEILWELIVVIYLVLYPQVIILNYLAISKPNNYTRLPSLYQTFVFICTI